MNIYVGNLSWQMTDEDLRNLFEQHGAVASAKIVKDKVSGRSKASVLLKWKTMVKHNRQLPACMIPEVMVAKSS